MANCDGVRWENHCAIWLGKNRHVARSKRTTSRWRIRRSGLTLRRKVSVRIGETFGNIPAVPSRRQHGSDPFVPGDHGGQRPDCSNQSGLCFSWAAFGWRPQRSPKSTPDYHACRVLRVTSGMLRTRKCCPLRPHESGPAPRERPFRATPAIGATTRRIEATHGPWRAQIPRITRPLWLEDALPLLPICGMTAATSTPAS